VRAHVLIMMFCSYLQPIVCMKAHVLLTMFGSSLPPVVCVRAHVLIMMFCSSLQQTTGGKDEPNIVNKT
jgi:hypothetical protein